MTWVVAECVGACACLIGLMLALRRKGPRPAIWPAMLALLLVSAVVHVCEALEWLGQEQVGRFGEVLGVLVPAQWLFVLFILRREQLAEEIRRMQEAVQHSNRSDLVALLSGSVAHDVRNMLMAMQMQAELIEMGGLEPARLRAATETLHEAIGTSSRLLGDLTALNRLKVTKRSSIDLGELVRNAERLLAGCLHPGLELKLEIESSSPIRILAAPIKLKQLLLNLVVNARDSMADTGEIRISVRARDGVAVVSVSDQGRGIAPEVRARMFEPLFTTKSLESGTGLGLSIVQRIVDEHGGTIRVNDVDPHGTVFEVAIPLLDATEAASSPAAPVRGDDGARSRASRSLLT